MSKKILLRVTATRVYEANPKYYPGCKTPEEFAEVDLSGDLWSLLDSEETTFAVTVEPTK